MTSFSYFVFDLNLAHWDLGVLGEKQELDKCQDIFLLWNFIFHMPTQEHKTRDSRCQKGTDDNVSAMCW